MTYDLETRRGHNNRSITCMLRQLLHKTLGNKLYFSFSLCEQNAKSYLRELILYCEKPLHHYHDGDPSDYIAIVMQSRSQC